MKLDWHTIGMDFGFMCSLAASIFWFTKGHIFLGSCCAVIAFHYAACVWGEETK